MNLNDIWSREPNITANNLRIMTLLVSIYETIGFDLHLPRLGPFPFKDVIGFTV